MTSESSRFCFVRHGETDWNVELRMQGQIDLALNARGEKQALAVGRYFAGRHAAAIYSSDLVRARQTAQPAADALLLPLILMTELRERHFGRCEGLTFDEIKTKYPDDAAAIISRDPDYVSPGGESRHQHKKRILECVARLATRHRAETVVLVTHGGVLDVIYRHVFGLPSSAPRDYPIPNAGINWVTIGADGWKIDEWGGVAHLA
jgi:probable phosphoglycerate mutase